MAVGHWGYKLRMLATVFISSLTPLLPQPVKFPGRKVHTCTPADSIFDDHITNILSTLWNLIEIILSPAHAKGEKSLNNFKFGTFTGRFPSDGVASMAAKGLISLVISVDHACLPFSSELRGCWKVEVAALGSPSLTVSADVKRH